MTRHYVNQLANGDSVDECFLVADKQLRANRQGNLYLHLELRDKSEGHSGAVTTTDTGKSANGTQDTESRAAATLWH